MVESVSVSKCVIKDEDSLGREKDLERLTKIQSYLEEKGIISIIVDDGEKDAIIILR